MTKKEKSKVKKRILLIVKWIFAIFPFIVLMYVVNRFNNSENEIPINNQSKTKTEVQDLSDSLKVELRDGTKLRKIKVIKNEWRPVGGVIFHNITIQNNLNIDLKGVSLKFQYLSDDKKIIASKILKIKEDISSGDSLVKEDLQVGYVNRSISSCTITVIGAEI